VQKAERVDITNSQWKVCYSSVTPTCNRRANATSPLCHIEIDDVSIS